MKTPTTFILLALGAASLSGALTLPASAQTSKPSSTQNCDNKSTARDKVLRPDSRCLNAPSETHTEEQAALEAGRIRTFAGGGLNKDNNPYEVHRNPNGSGDVRTFDLNTGVTSYIVHNSNGTISTFATRPGSGGSGGGRGATSTK